MAISQKIGDGLGGLIPSSKPHGGIKGVLESIISDMSAASSQYLVVDVEDLGAGVDIAERVIWAPQQDVRILGVRVWGLAASAGVDDANPSTWNIYRDDNSQDIITDFIFDAGGAGVPFPAANTPLSLGTPDATNRDVLAGEVVLLDILNGATADLPALKVQIEYQALQGLSTAFE